jgi:two-component system, oxyanion-binding sensor
VIETSLAGMLFDIEGANAPAPVHAAWLAGQMQRWGHIAAHHDLPALAAQVYRPDLHALARAALSLAPINLPSALREFAPQ